MKRALCITLSLLLVFLCAVPTFAASKDSQELEKMITIAKSIVSVTPDSNFSYDSYKYEDTDLNLWNLHWNTDNTETSVQILSTGLLLSYYTYEWDVLDESTKISTLSKEDCKLIADDFLAKILPSAILDSLVLADTYVSQHENTYTFNIVKDSKGEAIPVNGSYVSVGVNKQKNEVTSYYSSNLYEFMNVKLPSTDGIISMEKALDIYKNEGLLNLYYVPVYDNKGDNYTAFLAYGKKNSDIFIDAFSGKVFSPYDSYVSTKNAGSEEADLVSEESSALSPAEIEKVEAAEDLLSCEDADKLLKSKITMVPKNAKLDSYDSTTLRKDQQVWYLYYENAFAMIDASTGEILSFSYFDSYPSSKRNISYDVACKNAKTLLKNCVPLKLDETVLQKDIIESYDDCYIIKFSRIKNGILVQDNYITASVAKANGKVYSFDVNWDNIESFPSPDIKITKEEALNKFAEKDNFSLEYILDDENSKLAYGFLMYSCPYIDAVTGDFLNYEGKKYTGASLKDTPYPDIENKWYESYVTTLYNNGYSMPWEKFNGNATITQEEFLRYLYSPEQSYYSSEEFYNMLKDFKMIKEEEIAKDSIINRYDAIKFLVRYLGLEKAATLSDIYKTSIFKDTIAPGYAGYVALAKGMAIIKGNEYGCFDGAKALTRAEAAVMILNTLNSK